MANLNKIDKLWSWGGKGVRTKKIEEEIEFKVLGV